MTFADLGGAVEKCRADFGIDIEINVDALRLKGEAGFSAAHFAVGTIHYEKRDPGAKPGMLIYVKSSLTGREPADVLAYKAQYPRFPHESTADQWFKESQFESYRALGQYIIERVFNQLKDQTSPTTADELYAKFQAPWERSA